MEVENPAEWRANRGPVTVATVVALLAGGSSIVWILIWGPSFPASELLVVTAIGAPTLGLTYRRIKNTWAPRTIEILPEGVLGFFDRGPSRYRRVEVPFGQIRSFNEGTATGWKTRLFAFPHVVARGTYRLDGWKPLTSDRPVPFGGPLKSIQVALTESNLAAVRSAHEAWLAHRTPEGVEVASPSRT